MRITSHGAAEGVTGSSHLVEVDRLRLLVDCGMFQGEEAMAGKNAGFSFDPGALDAVLLTHGHLDHCGRLPLLVRNGYDGPVIATSGTRDIVRSILIDSAQVQADEARRRRERGQEDGPTEPLYTEDDVERAMERFDAPASYGQPVQLSPSVRATFRDAGHVLGSAFISIESGTGDGRRAVVFSGHLGNLGPHVVPDPVLPERSDLLLMESTYGDRNHRSVEASITELGQTITHVVGRGGNVLIPTFALERAQDVLFYLGGLVRLQRIPAVPIFLDSPLAIDITRIYRRHVQLLDGAVQELIEAGHDPFRFEGVEFAQTPEQSKAINGMRGVIVLAGGGMCQGGRILHHLRHNLWKEEAAVVFVGYQARGTLGRRIVEGAPSVRIHGRDVEARASRCTINGFSAHADQAGLLRWAQPCRGGRTALVHGDEPACAALAEVLRDELEMSVEVPALGETMEL